MIEFEPHELLPTIPPIIARFAVEVSGPKNSPCFARSKFSSLRTTPGWTRTRRVSVLISRIRPKCRERSTTSPSPTTCPASEVPAVRGMIPIRFSLANRMISLTSDSDFGKTTAIGIS